MLCLPGALAYLHDDKIAVIPFRRPTGNKATFLKAPLRPEVPVKGVEVDSIQGGGGENMAEQGGDGIGSIALIPTVTIADHDP